MPINLPAGLPARKTLEKEGDPAEAVAARMVEVLSGHALYATSPNWDQKWLSDLLEAGGGRESEDEVRWMEALDGVERVEVVFVDLGRS